MYGDGTRRASGYGEGLRRGSAGPGVVHQIAEAGPELHGQIADDDGGHHVDDALPPAVLHQQLRAHAVGHVHGPHGQRQHVLGVVGHDVDEPVRDGVDAQLRREGEDDGTGQGRL